MLAPQGSCGENRPVSFDERPSSASSWFPGLLALAATLGGVTALVMAAVLFVGRTGGDSASAVPSTVMAGATTTSFDSAPGTWVALTDDTETIHVEVPSHWDDVATGGWVRGGEEVGAALSASVDREAWLSGWETPGIFVGVTDTMAVPDALGDYQGDCLYEGSEPYELAGLSGVAEWWSGCGTSGSGFFVAAVAPDDDSFVLLVQVITLEPSGGTDLDRILQSLRYG